MKKHLQKKKKTEHAWWKTAVVYEIMTKSFKDSSNNGWGDLYGVIEKLDYLQELGVTAIWLTPVQVSGGCDNGYDIVDYFDIEKSYGGLKALKELVKEMKKRSMKLLFDMVMSHTSNKHKWFLDSRSSSKNKYSNYYVWSDQKIDPPDSAYGKCCYEEDPWKYDPKRKKYFYHMFASEMPDLNYSNPKVRSEFIRLLKFYINLGVEGFRFDVVDLIGKDIFNGYTTNGPNLSKYIKELLQKGLGKDHYEKYLTVAEAASATPKNACNFAGLDGSKFSMTFNLSALYTDTDPVLGKLVPKKFNPQKVRDLMYEWQENCDNKSWNALVTQNHDTGRIATSKWVSPRYWNQGCKTVAISMLSFRGTPFIYQGEEIGMTQLISLDKKHYPDPEAKGKYDEMVTNKKLMSEVEYFTEYLWKTGRDGAKTPMQWNRSKNAGFNSGCKTWLPVNENYKEINVQDQRNDPESIWHVYKKLIHLRTKNEETSRILLYGTFSKNVNVAKTVFDYQFTYKKKTLRVVGNWSDNKTHTIQNPRGEIIINSNSFNKTSTLGKWEGRVYLNDEN